MYLNICYIRYLDIKSAKLGFKMHTQKLKGHLHFVMWKLEESLKRLGEPHENRLVEERKGSGRGSKEGKGEVFQIL